MREFTPRPYQQECLDTIKAKGPGRYLCKLATGLGKTAIFTHVPRDGRMLILSHREELVHQPLGWYDGTGIVTGVEQAGEYAPTNAEVVSASVQTNSCPNLFATASSTFTASPTISGPMPSPGRRAIFRFILLTV